MVTYVKAKEARKILNVTDATLREWASAGYIDYIRVAEGSCRLYNVEGFVASRLPQKEQVEKKYYIYCRVSSSSQKEDLERQAAFLAERYPKHEIVKDIGSGINFKRKGLNKILADTFKGIVSEVVVAHRDRLCRIAYEHFEWLFKFYGTNLIVEDKQEFNPEFEFNEDLFAIIHVFSARHYGMRRNYTIKKSSEEKNERIEEEGKCITHKNVKNRTKQN
jgi:predicted site-specific integrase-resolvase